VAKIFSDGPPAPSPAHRAELVKIVDQEQQRALERAQFVGQPSDDSFAVQAGSRLHLRYRRRAGARPAQCLHDREPEPGRIVLLTLSRDPGHVLRQTTMPRPPAVANDVVVIVGSVSTEITVCVVGGIPKGLVSQRSDPALWPGYSPWA
jgi:hypothetical protein